jgi:hypothetical protein
MPKPETKDAIDLAIAALQRAKEYVNPLSFDDEMDTAIREIGDAVVVEECQPTNFSMEVMPVIIQLMLMSRHTQLNTNPRGENILEKFRGLPKILAGKRKK